MSTEVKDNHTVLESVFNKYDRDKSGGLTVNEFALLLKDLSKHVPEVRGIEPIKARAIFSLLDKNADGSLNFSEFASWWNQQDKYRMFCGEKARLLRKAYWLFSSHTSSKSLMNHEEFNLLLLQLGMNSVGELNFIELDTDNDGGLSFEEFCHWLNWF